MAACQSLVPQVEICTLHSPGILIEEKSPLFCPWFPSKPCSCLPVSSNTTNFQNSKFQGLLQCGPAHFLQGSVSPHFPVCQPAQGKQFHNYTAVQSLQKIRKILPWLAALNQNPHFCAWEWCNTLAPPIYLMTQCILRLCCHSWDSIQFCHQACPPWQWTSKSSDFVFCCL